MTALSPSEGQEALVLRIIDWVREQQGKYRPLAYPLPPALRTALSPVLSASTLDRVRVWRVDEIESPSFLPDALKGQQADGFTIARTYGDLILYTPPALERSTAGIFCHEVAHVIQYECLTFEGLLRRYVSDALAFPDGYQWASPLEIIAYAVEGRFSGGMTFSAEHMVRAALRNLGLVPVS